MKTQFILSLLLFSVITAGAKAIQKIENPTYVGINDGTMKIVSVKTTEEATVLTFQYPGEGFHQFAPTIHLVDELGKHYELIGQKGFSEDSLKNMKPTKKGKYELRFEPLPAKTHIFDIIEDYYNIESARYYGVREKGTPFSITNPLPHNEGVSLLPYMDFKVDTVLVTGHIKDYFSIKNKFKGVWKYTYSPLEKTDIPQTSIDGNGDFCMKVRTIGPTWTYLLFPPIENSNKALFIPVMLYPGDHIDLQITLDEENNQKDVAYKSKLQRDFSKLMKILPLTNVDMGIGRSYNKLEEIYEKYERMTPESVQKQFDDYDALALYLSGKYGLNRLETEMLRSNLSVEMAINVVGITNNYLFKVKRQPVQPEEDIELRHSKWRNSDSPYYGISFSNIRAESNAFMVTPYWTNLLSAQNMHNNPRHEKMSNDFVIYTERFVHGDTLRLTKTGEVPHFLVLSTPEEHEKDRILREKEFEWYYDWELQLVREWRQKEKDDTLFEQAFLFSLLSNLRIGVVTGSLDNRIMSISMTRLYQQGIRARQLYHHPSIVRMASTLIEELIQEIYQRQDEDIEELKKKQQSNKQ